MALGARSRAGHLWAASAVAAFTAIATVYVSIQEPPNKLATGLLGGFTLLTTTWVAWEFGKASAVGAAEEMIRPHARSAFRRMRNLYSALGRQNNAIASQLARLEGLAVNGRIGIEHVRASMDVLTATVIEQISTADDALEDWRDLVPDEVAAIEAVEMSPDQAASVAAGEWLEAAVRIEDLPVADGEGEGDIDG